MSRLGIFGTSGFAREVADIAYELDYAPFFIARDEGELNAWGEGIRLSLREKFIILLTPNS